MLDFKGVPMSNSHSLSTIFRHNLKHSHPHRKWQYQLFLLLLIITAGLFVKDYCSRLTHSLSVMALIALTSYWWTQIRLLRLAVHFGRQPIQRILPDDMIGSVTQLTIIKAQFYAMLRHHLFFLSMVIVIMLLFSTELAFMLLNLVDRGLLQHVGVVASGQGDYPYNSKEHFMIFSVVMSIAFIMTTVCDSLLSFAIGLWAKHFGRGLLTRVLILFSALGLFLCFYALREIPALTCYRNRMIYTCTPVLTPIRILDSFQVITLSFLDGGATLITGLYACDPFTLVKLDSYQGRHLLAGGVLVTLQIGLSIIFLRRHIVSKFKRKPDVHPSPITTHSSPM